MSTTIQTAAQTYQSEREAWLAMSVEERNSLAQQLKQGEAFMLACPGPSPVIRAILDADHPDLDLRYTALPMTVQHITLAAPPSGHDVLLEKLEQKPRIDYSKLAAKHIRDEWTVRDGKMVKQLFRYRWMLFQWTPFCEPGLRSYVGIAVAEDPQTLTPIGDAGGVPSSWVEDTLRASTYHLRNEHTAGNHIQHMVKAAAQRREQMMKAQAEQFRQQQYVGFETAKYAVEAVKAGKHERIIVGAGD
ncbi:MAG: hypothetical protein EBR82_45610 [Caulobacteraceae bacterium]|nr:hypothetical protein [Caulobacteraceae bacterium]